MQTASIIGSGPNGLAAAITLASVGVTTTVLERGPTIGGACSTAEITLPGFRHDLGSSVYPMGVISPFLRSLPISLPWIQSPSSCAHPLDDGTAVMLEASIEDTIANLDGVDEVEYRRVFEPLANRFPELIEGLLRPITHFPKHPLLLARFGVSALFSASTLARSRFSGLRARALLAGMAAHSVLPLEAPGSAAVALVLIAAGHASGWPILRGGAQTLTDALAKHFNMLKGRIATDCEVTRLPSTDLILADVTPKQLLKIAGAGLPANFRRRLGDFRYGAGIFKIDYALNAPIPWTAKECFRAATVHLGGTFEEIADSERNFVSGRPFVLLVQPSLFDPSRAPQGQHTAWAYCHVPNGSAINQLEAIENQIIRFAPAFRQCVLARTVSPPTELERWNPNLIGGDLTAGAMNLKQIVFRPTPSLYRTPLRGLYMCGASTPPGGGVHGMAGYHSAQAAIRDYL